MNMILSESIEFDWFWKVRLVTKIKGRTWSIVIKYGAQKGGVYGCPKHFFFWFKKQGLAVNCWKTYCFKESRLYCNPGTCREKLCGSSPCPAWWPGALLLWSQWHTRRKSSPRHPTLQVKVCALLSDLDVPFWFCNEIGETPNSKTSSAKSQSRSAWPWSGLRNLAGSQSTTISASSKALSWEPTGSIWTGEDG